MFFVKTWFWTFSSLEWIFWHPKNLKIIGLTKEFLLILAIFGKTWKKESKFRKLWKNVFRICIPICGLRMKLFNFISHYFNFFERHFFLSLSECIGVLNLANHKVKVEITCSQKVVFFLWKRVWRRFTLRMRISYKKAFFTCFALEWAFLEFLM